MKKLLRKFLSFATAVCVICSVLSVGTPLKLTVSAASESDLTFNLNSDGKSYYVASCNKDASGDLTIPSTYNSLPVRGIDDRAFQFCRSLESITISNGVTSIGWLAFSDCTSLTSVTLPDSITCIDENAFQFCTNLTSITIPDGATGMVSNAFYDTAYYDNGDNWSNNALYIGNHLIEAKPIGGDYVIKAGTKTIVGCAFRNCKNLESVTIPDGLTSIGSEAFSYCTSLATVTIPDSVTSIGGWAFNGCNNLESVYINDLESWLNIKFSNYVSSNPLEFADYLYINGQLATDVVIPDGVTSIPEYGLNCKNITSVTIPDSVTSISGSAFENNRNVTIRCHIGSYAHIFAEKNGIKYSLLEMIPVGKTSISSLSKRIYTEQSGKNAVDEIVTSEIYSVIAIPSFVNGTANYYGTGSAIGFLKNGALEFIYKLVVYGDLNGDSTVDVLDVAIAEKVASKTLSLDGDFLLAADFDSSGDIGVTDYQQIVNSALS